MRSVPYRFAEACRYSYRLDARRRRFIGSGSDRRTRERSSAHVNLRIGPGGSCTHRVSAEIFFRRSYGTLRGTPLPGGRLPCGRFEAFMNPALVELTIDGGKVSVPEGTTVFDAARLNNIRIPTLCHQQNEVPVGVCRVCVVDVGGRVLTASCVRPVESGMVVSTTSEKVRNARRTLVELLMSDHPSPCARQQQSGDCELEVMARAEGVENPRFARRATSRGRDDSSVAIAVDHDACILCDRCIRGCDDIRHNDVLGRMGKGYRTGIAFDQNLPMGNSSCVSCGECMISCPTGALTNKFHAGTSLRTGEPASPQVLHELPVFAGVSGTFLELNRGAIVVRHFRPGEIICREGEYGSTAFYMLEGHAQVSINAQKGHVKTEGGARVFSANFQATSLAERKIIATKNRCAARFPSMAPRISRSKGLL